MQAMQHGSNETPEDLAGVSGRVLCAQIVFQAFLDAGFRRREAFVLTRDNFPYVFSQREHAAMQRRAVSLPTPQPADTDSPDTFPVPRRNPPVESAEQAAARFAGAILGVIEELTSQGLERSDAVEIGGYTAYALGHVMASRLCPN